MILYDKASLEEKLGKRIARDIETLLTPESEEKAVKYAFEHLLLGDFNKLTKKYGYIPAEIYVASGVGALRVGNASEGAGSVAIDDFNEAISLDPSLDNDTLLREPYIYGLVRTHADQGDPAMQAVLADLYTGDVVAPGDCSRLEADGMDEEKLRGVIAALREAGGENADAVKVTGIDPAQLAEELDGRPYENNIFAKARKFMNEGRRAEKEGDKTLATENFFEAALLGNIEAGRAYAAMTSSVFEHVDRKKGIKQLKKLKKIQNRLERSRNTELPFEKKLSFLDDPRVEDSARASYVRGELLAEEGRTDEAITEYIIAAEGGCPDACRVLADYYASGETFDYDNMMRYLLLGCVNPGNYGVYGEPLMNSFVFTARGENRKMFEYSGKLLAKLSYCRDFVDELGELSDSTGGENVPELSDRRKESVFSRFLCDPGCDASREVLARLYYMGFGTGENREKAWDIWRGLCEKYDGQTENGAENVEEGQNAFAPDESRYETALRMITADGVGRDTEGGKALLAKIGADSPWRSKAEKLLALADTDTAELVKLGAMFKKQDNTDGMLKVYNAASMLGDGMAPRLLGRYYSDKEQGNDTEKALRFYKTGAERGDVPSMYFGGSLLMKLNRPEEAAVYFKMAAEEGGGAPDIETRAVAARAMRDLAEVYYSGALTGEKDVAHFLYYLDWAEKCGFRLGDTTVDKRRAADNYFMMGQWLDALKAAEAGDDERYLEWITTVCEERKIIVKRENRVGKKNKDVNKSGRTADGKTGPAEQPAAEESAPADENTVADAADAEETDAHADGGNVPEAGNENDSEGGDDVNENGNGVPAEPGAGDPPDETE